MIEDVSGKFMVRRKFDPTSKDEKFLVLDLTNDEHAGAGIHEYAFQIRKINPDLARKLGDILLDAHLLKQQ